jgi:hypothetical protein
MDTLLIMRRQYVILLFATMLACTSKTERTEKVLDKKDGINDIFEDEEVNEALIGERIDGPANVRDKENGTIILSLDDDVLVETIPEQDGWYQIGFYIQLDKDTDPIVNLDPETHLRNIDGQPIGRTKVPVEVWRMDDSIGLIEGFTYRDNIKKHSIPEIALEREIRNGHFTFSALKQYVESFKFMEYELNPSINYRQLFIYESSIVDPSPRDRITLLFDENENLVGIFHSRELLLPQYETYELTRGHSYTCIADLDNNEKQRIIDERVSFYNSVD